MKKILAVLFFTIITSITFAGMNDKDESKTIECTGIYYANSMIPQGELELEKIVHSFAAKKFLNSYFCLLYTSPSPRDVEESRMPSSA